MNPLLDFSGLPRFSEIQPEHVTPAVDQLLQDNRALVERIANDAQSPTWDRFVAPLDDANERLSRAWGQVAHLNAVMNSPALREVYNANLPKITQYYTGIVAGRSGCFANTRQCAMTRASRRLHAAQRKIIDNELRDFRLGGAELPADKKARVQASCARSCDKLSSRFSDNVLDATNAFARLRHRSCRAVGHSGRRAAKPPRPPHARTARRAGSSRCRCRRICRSCSTPTTVRCASALSRLRHARGRVRRPAMEQHAAHRGDPASAA